MGEPSAVEVLGRLVPSLALIVGALLLVRRWAARTRGTATDAPGVKIVARAGVTRTAAVAIVQVGARRFLVGAGEHGVALLSELDTDPSVLALPPADAAGATGFTRAGATSFPPAGAAGFSRATKDRSPRSARSALLSDRPGMGLIHRLKQMTVRTHLEADLRVPQL